MNRTTTCPNCIYLAKRFDELMAEKAKEFDEIIARRESTIRVLELKNKKSEKELAYIKEHGTDCICAKCVGCEDKDCPF